MLNNMKEYSFQVLSKGQVMTNKFLYPDEKREIVCTTTLIQGQQLNILVDPGWHDEALLTKMDEIRLAPSDIQLVYLTHLHADHIRSIRLFPQARWLVGMKEREGMKDKISPQDRDIWEQLQPVGTYLHEDILVVDTPGHTLGHTSLLFKSGGQRVVIAADAVLTREYYEHREVHLNSADKELAKQSIEFVRCIADLIIPGHDQPFQSY